MKMKILVLSSRTGKALTLLHALYPVHSAVFKGEVPEGVCHFPSPYYDEDWLALRNMNFDVVISLGFMKHISRILFGYTPTINVHPGKLPIFKGKDPHLQALKARVTQTAVTIHEVSEEIDSGKILVEVPVRIYQADTPERLEQRLRLTAVYAVISLLHGMEKGE
jgi:folate-dependent phosphoribosylglycinamide formyltransferase PurN